MYVDECYWDVDAGIGDAIACCVEGVPLQFLPSLAGADRSVPELTGPTELMESMSSVARFCRPAERARRRSPGAEELQRHCLCLLHLPTVTLARSFRHSNGLAC